MKIIVQKFGGTSVSTHESRCACVNKIKKSLDEGYMVVAVVSAMGRKGAPYATDTLLTLPYDQGLDKRDRDLIMSCGETISSVVFSSLLNSQGINANAVTGFQAGIITNTDFGYGKCELIYCDYIKTMLDQGCIPVVTGFQGLGGYGEIVTLGRGGSDTTAALLGSALKAERIDIFTDVDGIMTSDPRIVKNSVIIDEISSEEVFQMAAQGAKVIHPNAVEAATLGGIDMYIKNTFTDSNGTRITPDLLIHNPKDINDAVSSVACLKNRAQVSISTIGEEDESVILRDLANDGISIDLINIFAHSMVFTIGMEDVECAKKVFEKLNLSYETIENLSKITAIGSKMRGVPGVMAKIVKALLAAGCVILQSADSHMHISCLVHDYDDDKAVIAIHDEFELGKEKHKPI